MFKVKCLYPGGETEIDDEMFQTYREAKQHAEEMCSNFLLGTEILSRANPDTLTVIDGEMDYEIIESA